MARNVVSKKSNRKASIFSRVAALIEGAWQRVAQVANIAQVYTNYEIGRQIVEEEQGGKRRAEYGKQIIEDLSLRLTQRFGRGWGTSNLEYMRKFYLMYSTLEISQTPFGESATVLRKSDREEIHNSIVEIQDAVNSANTVYEIPKFTLGWSHYLLLMRIADLLERAFYEREAAERNWSLFDIEVSVSRPCRRLGTRRETIGVRRKGIRRETIDTSHVPRLVSTSSRLSSNVSRPSHPTQKGLIP